MICSEHPQYKLYVTDDPANEVLDEFIWEVVLDGNPPDNLIDNPYTYRKLKALVHSNSFKYALIWLNKDDKPFYGFFCTQYKELPSSVARFYVRMYTIDRQNNPLGLKFIKHEHDMYAKHFVNILEEAGIDTLFFTRHSQAVKDEKKYILGQQYAKRWYGYDVHNVLNQMFKGIEQNVHYFNAWQPNKPLNTLFLDKLERV